MEEAPFAIVIWKHVPLVVFAAFSRSIFIEECFIPAFIFKTEKFYDLTGSLTYITAILFALYSTNTPQNLDLGSLIIGIAIILWAIRLGSFLFMRIHKDKKDGRFDSIKTSFSQFFMTWTLQGMWVFICSSCWLDFSQFQGIFMRLHKWMGLLKGEFFGVLHYPCWCQSC